MTCTVNEVCYLVTNEWVVTLDVQTDGLGIVTLPNVIRQNQFHRLPLFTSEKAFGVRWTLTPSGR